MVFACCIGYGISAAHVVALSAGEGEFGVVHKAIWNGTLVAVKILKISSAIALADFRSELEVRFGHAWPLWGRCVLDLCRC